MMVSVGVINVTVGARAIWVRGCVHNVAVIFLLLLLIMLLMPRGGVVDDI